MDSDASSFTEETLTESSSTSISSTIKGISTSTYDSTFCTNASFTEETLTTCSSTRTSDTETRSNESYTSLVSSHTPTSEDYSTEWSQESQITVPHVVADKQYVIHALKTEDQKKLDRFDSKYKNILHTLRVRPISKAPCSPKTEKRYPVKFYDNVRLLTLTTVRDNTLQIPLEVKRELEYQRALSKLRSQR